MYLNMENKDCLESNLEVTFLAVSEWKGSSKDMWKRIDERMQESRQKSIFTMLSLTAVSLASIAICIALIFNEVIQKRLFKDNNINKNYHAAAGSVTSTLEEGPSPDKNTFEDDNSEINTPENSMTEPTEYKQLESAETLDINGHHSLSALGWNYSFNDTDSVFTPDQSVTLDIRFYIFEDLEILEEDPDIVIGRLPKTTYIEDIKIPLPELKNRLLKKGTEFNFKVNFKAPEKPGEYLISIDDIMVQCGKISRLAYAGGKEFKVVSQNLSSQDRD